MRDIFASPDIPPDQQKFVRGLASRPVEINWKWGGWQRDDVIVIGPGRHFLLAALMQHAHGDDYPVVLAPAVNDLMIAGASSR